MTTCGLAAAVETTTPTMIRPRARAILIRARGPRTRNISSMRRAATHDLYRALGGEEPMGRESEEEAMRAAWWRET